MKAIGWTLAILLMFSAVVFAGDKVPYKATLASTSAVTTPADPTDPAQWTPEVMGFLSTRCPMQPAFYVELKAVGTMTHSGLVTDTQGHCVSLLPASLAPALIGRAVPDQPNVMVFYGGKAELTSANGDILFGNYDGYLEMQPDGMVIHGVFLTYDGTGRFQGVTGTGTAFGVQTFGPAGVSATLTLNGTQSSAGAAKK